MFCFGLGGGFNDSKTASFNKAPSSELFNFDPTGRTPNAEGGRVSLSNGGLANILGV